MIKNIRGRGLVVVAAVVAIVAVSGVGGATAATLITSKQIKDGTLVSADVKNGGLGLVDLNGAAQRAIRQRGPAGPQGAQGPAGPGSVLNSQVVQGSGSANCPPGTRMTGGGVGTIPSDSHSTSFSSEYSVTGSYPSGNGWRVTAKEIKGTYYGSTGWKFSTWSYSAQAYAVCAS